MGKSRDASLQNLQTEAERLLEDLVNMSSPTGDAFAVNQVQHRLAALLNESGFETRFLPNTNPHVRSGDLLTATLRGPKGSPRVTMVAHADTVLTTDEAGRFERTRDKKIARGSGIIDNKGGLVVALMGIKHFLNKRSPYTLRFVISPNEEGGSIGFHSEFAKISRESDLVLGFEPALEDGSIVKSRRGNRWYKIRVTGQEAHAGRCRGEEMNAAHDLAKKITKLAKLNRLRAGVGVNVGHIEGGRDRYNIVCGEATAKLDVRFGTFEDRDDVHEKIEAILQTPFARSEVTGRTTETTYTVEDDCPPFASSSASKKLLKLYLEAATKIEGTKIKAERAGGAGDVNYMSRKDVIVFDGLGPVGGKMHTPEEFIRLETLGTRSLALSNFLEISAPLLARLTR